VAATTKGVYVRTVPLKTEKLTEISLESLNKYRQKHLKSVRERISDFRGMRIRNGERIFYELCYCILTPQSKGMACDKVVAGLVSKGVLDDPFARREELEDELKNVRFWRKKTEYLNKARKRFFKVDSDLAKEISHMEGEFDHARDLRNWLRAELRGMGIGMKEASHFLRNIGYGEGLAIIDRHVLKCMGELHFLIEEPIALNSDKDYLRAEELISDFSIKSKIPLEELDLLFWSAKTGYIFK
jgi:N-glycosylase/DNA lyase